MLLHSEAWGCVTGFTRQYKGDDPPLGGASTVAVKTLP
ncbi:hypothetical protein A33Q_4034 [Indibacter alkaliphilus LW1]|uniref:Uncharacterized protein n=1 Tax=Indibacter alkaliphilus (strain CCUG 57479 / KCTC 22604 / LW1) TaxID=1189612 RepID=S2DJ02_INDAL|nr:hypothetical protein A33Q_4034 [Indibacter alkaliphilus LW1]